MKGLVVGIFAAFAVLTAFSLYIAGRTYDGTVEERYYEKSLRYFRRGGGAEARPPSGPFVAFADGQKIIFDIGPKPIKAMRELLFSVELPGYGGSGTPWIDLGMTGMRMPPNRVDLAKESDGRYRGKGVVVRCPSGMRTWMAAVHVPGKGNALFLFDVAD